MARKPRIHYEGALYHVIARGNNRKNVFEGENEKEEYLRIVKRYKERYGFKIYSYCIMDNHTHLLIEVEKTPLSKIMQGIQQVYTQRYNIAKKQTGHVFEQRYKAILCDKDSYLLNLVRYIHQNPIKACIKDGIEYKWSSHVEYIDQTNRMLADKEFVLGLFSGNKKEAVKRYIDFIDIEEGMDISKIKSEEIVLDKIKYEKRLNQLKNELSYNNLKKEVCKLTGINEDEIMRRNRVQRFVDARKALVILSKKYCDISNREMAKDLNLSEPSISKIIRESQKVTGRIKVIIEHFEDDK